MPSQDSKTERRLWQIVLEQRAEIRRLTDRAISRSLVEYSALRTDTEPVGPDPTFVTDEEAATRWEERMRANGWSDEDIEVAKVGE